jgi:hypothetical protein
MQQPGLKHLVAAGMLIGGAGEFGARFFAPLLALAASLAVWRLMRGLFDVQIAGWAVVIVNVLPALIGTPDKPLRDHLVIAPSNKKNLALREGRWLYIGAQGGGGFNGRQPGDHALGGPGALKFTGEINSDIADGKIKPDAPDEQLYDLTTDPSQSRNIVRAQPEIAARLKARLAQIQSQPSSVTAP